MHSELVRVDTCRVDTCTPIHAFPVRVHTCRLDTGLVFVHFCMCYQVLCCCTSWCHTQCVLNNRS